MRITSMDLLATHLVGDFVVQNHELSQAKLTDPVARVRHVNRYAVCFLPLVLLLSRAPAGRRATFLVALWVSHYATDSRRWLPNEDWAPGTIVNDQALHALQLAVLGRLL